MRWPEHKLPEWVMAAIKRDEAIEDAERAVIEAARDVGQQGCLAAERLTRQEHGDEYGDRFARLFHALEALDAAERGDDEGE